MNMIPGEGPILLIVADHHHARLLTCTRLRTGRIHVDLLSKLGEQWKQENHERQASRSGPLGHSFENIGHTHEERIHRFAKEIAAWLVQEIPKQKFERLVLLAEPGVLGVLRREAPASLRKNWIEHAIDLGGLSEGELAKRPELAALLPVVKD